MRTREEVREWEVAKGHHIHVNDVVLIYANRLHSVVKISNVLP